MKKSDRVIVALDTQDFNECKKLVKALKGKLTFFKVGKELFTSVGRKAVDYIHDQGGNVFLDLKFHDIPNTVAKATEAAASMGVKMMNVHALGGKNMMNEAKKAAKANGNPWVLGVTILTSHNELELKQELKIQKPLNEMVIHLASLAKEAKLDGVVASAWEVEAIKKTLGKAFKVVTPGIRPTWSAKNDQQRIVTPKQAFERGSDFIVIGRPITAALDIKGAAELILEEICT